MGKTRLALHVAAAVAADFPDGVWFVPLAPVRDPDLVASTIAQELGVAEARDRPLAEAVAAFLAERRALLVLDNFEHVLAAAPLVTQLLLACPLVKALVTSRAVLHLSGEHIIVIPPLASVDPERVPAVTRLREGDAVCLFEERARAANADFTLTEANAVDVAVLCARLDGLPLAIELAAARTRALSPRAMLQGLDQRLRLLSGGARDQPARLRSLHDAIAWSYDFLTPEEQALFRRLAVFIGGFTLDAAEAVYRDEPASGFLILDGIASLVDKSLLQPQHGLDDEPRYTMLETIREFGLEQLATHQETTPARSAHAAYFLTFAEGAAPVMLGQAVPDAWLDRLAADHDNLRTALEWLCGGDGPEDCLRLSAACGWFWYRRGHVAEGRARLQRALADASPEPTAAKARALNWAAALAIRAGDVVAAPCLAHEALTVWDAVGDPVGRAMALHYVARAEKHVGHWEEATARFEEELTVWRELGDPGSIGLVVMELGEIAFGQGDLANARTTMREAAAYLRQADERTWLAAADLYLGLFAVAEGRFAEAARHYRACLAGYAATGAAFVQSPLAGLARVAVAVDRPETAAQLLGLVDAELQRTGMQFDQAERVGYDGAATMAQAALGEAAFAAAYASGPTLSQQAWLAAADEIVAAAEAAEEPRRGRLGERPGGLTSREWDILRLIAEGHSDREAAEALFIGRGTVRSHLASIFGKLEVSSRSAAVAVARRRDLL